VTARTPHDDGFVMPAEWQPHDRCFISWPCREQTWSGHFEEAKRAYLGVIKNVNRFEHVVVLADPSTAKEARSRLGREMEILEIELDDSWIRDNGPIFVRNDSDRVALVKFGFNGWGNKLPSFSKDDHVPIALAKHLRTRHYVAPMVLEGGAISVDGEGTLLTTEQCLLNGNRNPDLTRGQIEQILALYLGIRKVVWLGKGVEEDMTDGHVDGVAGFAGPHLAIAAYTEDPSDPNFNTLTENIERLESTTDAKGRSIEIIRLVQPRPREVEGIHITPGYTNHYIANGCVIVPTYDISEDKAALETLMSVYPDREVIGVNCSYIEVGGGAVHCITQQKPTGTSISSWLQHS
jgi:agmatine deiminase